MGAGAGQPNIGGMQPQQQSGSESMPPQPQMPGFMPPQPQMPGVGGQGPMPPQPNMPGPMPPQPMPRDPSIDTLPNHHNMMFLRDLYQQELGRQSDKGGMNYWQQQMANGMSRDQIRQMFDQSEEGQAYNQRPPSDYFPPMPVMRPPPSDMDFLKGLYQQEFGREADQGGMDYWQQQMAGGMGRDQIQQMFDQSQEGQAYNQQPPRFANDPRNPHIGKLPMHPEIEDALRLANQPPMPQYTPEEWSRTFGPNVDPDPRVIKQDRPQGQGLPQGQNMSQAMGILRSLGVM